MAKMASEEELAELEKLSASFVPEQKVRPARFPRQRALSTEISDFPRVTLWAAGSRPSC